MAKVIIFSGAGISAQSGIPTFRDSNSLWENHNVKDICTNGCLITNRDMTIKFYDMLRMNLRYKGPNYAHRVIAKLKNRYPNDIAVITQNIDDLFEKVGSDDTLHIHGFLQELKCENCNHILNIEYEEQFNNYDNCPKCNNLLRPNIVFFGEAAPKYQDMFKEFDDCEFFVVIGTSGAVLNPDMFLNPNIKMSILNNLEPSSYIAEELYSKAIFKPFTQAIREIAFDIEEFLNK